MEIGGVFHTIVQNVHLESATDNPTTGYQTELVDAGGRAVKVCSWLKKTTCVKVACESKSDWNSPTELINIRKACSDVSVPRMNLLQYQAGNPPGRRFQLEPSRNEAGRGDCEPRRSLSLVKRKPDGDPSDEKENSRDKRKQRTTQTCPHPPLYAMTVQDCS